jgi:hypothetical protein
LLRTIVAQLFPTGRLDDASLGRVKLAHDQAAVRHLEEAKLQYVAIRVATYNLWNSPGPGRSLAAYLEIAPIRYAAPGSIALIDLRLGRGGR